MCTLSRRLPPARTAGIVLPLTHLRRQIAHTPNPVCGTNFATSTDFTLESGPLARNCASMTPELPLDLSAFRMPGWQTHRPPLGVTGARPASGRATGTRGRSTTHASRDGASRGGRARPRNGSLTHSRASPGRDADDPTLAWCCPAAYGQSPDGRASLGPHRGTRSTRRRSGPRGLPPPQRSARHTRPHARR